MNTKDWVPPGCPAPVNGDFVYIGTFDINITYYNIGQNLIGYSYAFVGRLLFRR